ncbi:hypothetical protein [Pseudothauera rhizosphaerae]|uniref:MazG nucleotide pyrophosphohydrolase domain-containing protein n=1 Tax=Pseudothauera rhizosphaerae TaxID=2565932 RepID=A0A4S4AW57_9RHOO|nr:hypothetical protein [Pseudothauera rhizosphaerae]THF64264.1 hypothetical protein E6O51_02795 [Pseudothauera rhizosphaerae]
MSTMQNVMMNLFEHAKRSMDDADMKEVANLTDSAADEARRLAAICESLGCLISSDGDNSPMAGSFRDSDEVSGLLWALGHSFDTIAAMVEVGDEATFHLNELRMKKASEGQA